MNFSIELPEDIQTALAPDWHELSRHVREALAAEGYRRGRLSLAQVRRLLGLPTRWDAQLFLGQAGVAVFDFDPAELDREQDLQTYAASRRV